MLRRVARCPTTSGLSSGPRGRADHKERQRRAKQSSDEKERGGASASKGSDSRSQSRSLRGQDGKGGGGAQKSGATAGPSESHSEELHPGASDDRMWVEPNGSIKDIMQRRLDDFMQTQGKAFVGEMVKSMVSGLAGQLKEVQETQGRTERRLDAVGTGLSEVREKLMAAEVVNVEREKRMNAMLADLQQLLEARLHVEVCQLRKVQEHDMLARTASHSISLRPRPLAPAALSGSAATILGVMRGLGSRHRSEHKVAVTPMATESKSSHDWLAVKFPYARGRHDVPQRAERRLSGWQRLRGRGHPEGGQGGASTANQQAGRDATPLPWCVQVVPARGCSHTTRTKMTRTPSFGQWSMATTVAPTCWVR